MNRKELEELKATGDVEDLLRLVDVVNRFDNVIELSQRLRKIREKRKEVLELYKTLRDEEKDLDKRLHSELSVLAIGE